MRRRHPLLAAALGVGVVAGAAGASPPLMDRPAARPCPPLPCPPEVVPPLPGTPGAATPTPPRPGDPATPEPMSPDRPPAPVDPAPTRPPAAPEPPDLGSLAQATRRGTAADRTALPGVFGDLPGGGGIAGPLPVRVSASGQFIGPAPQAVLPDGRRVTLNNPGGQRTLTDEVLLRRPATLPPGTPGRTVGLLPPPGTVFAPELADAVARLPLVTYGAFKITENESPRPVTRVYTSYYFYDNLFQAVGGPDTPRVTLHQEVFGYEQAFADGRFSVGLRLPYNQLSSPGFFNDTSLGNLTIVTKGVLVENEETGSLLSAGVVVTAPTASPPLASTITGQKVNPTLVQPYLGYILSAGDWFVQGFSSVVVPTSAADATFMANDIAVGHVLYRSPGSFLSSLVPVAEFHLNTPFDRRGARTEPVGFVDQLTLLGGAHAQFYDRSTLGFAVGAPITGPRPFSLQVTVQAGFRF